MQSIENVSYLVTLRLVVRCNVVSESAVSGCRMLAAIIMITIIIGITIIVTIIICSSLIY